MKKIFFLVSFVFYSNCITLANLKPKVEDTDLDVIKIKNKESILLVVNNDFEINNKKKLSSSKVNEYEIEFFIKILKESQFFSSVEKGLVKTDKKLIISLKGNTKVNYIHYYISAFTLMMIPFYFERDIEITYSFGEKKETIKEFKRSAQTQTFVQIFLLPVSIFTAITTQDNKHFETMTKSVLEEAYNEGIFQ